jgi:hypothetical protein
LIYLKCDPDRIFEENLDEIQKRDQKPEIGEDNRY